MAFRELSADVVVAEMSMLLLPPYPPLLCLGESVERRGTLFGLSSYGIGNRINSRVCARIRVLVVLLVFNVAVR